jgi:hypothetical protein
MRTPELSCPPTARLINLGQIYANTGRKDDAIRVLTQVLSQDDVELVLADGGTIGSREAARKSLALLRK